MKAYNQACDSLARHGVKGYKDVAEKYFHVKGPALDSLAKTMTYERVAAPREKDVEWGRRAINN